MTKKLESILRRIAADSASRVSDRKAKQDLESLLANHTGSLRNLCAIAKNPRLRQDVRGAACWALGQLGDPRAIPTLLDLIKRGGLVVTWESAKSLITLLDNNVGFTRRLEQTLRNGRRSHNRSAAAYVLGLAGRKESIPSLIDILQRDDNPNVRSHVAEALGNLRAADAVEPLIVALSDLNPEMRLSAVLALGEMGDERALPELKRLATAVRTRQSEVGSMKTHAKKAIVSIRRRSANQS